MGGLSPRPTLATRTWLASNFAGGERFMYRSWTMDSTKPGSAVMPDVEDLDDATLIELWNAADSESPTEYEQQVLDEMKRREIV